MKHVVTTSKINGQRYRGFFCLSLWHRNYHQVAYVVVVVRRMVAITDGMVLEDDTTEQGESESKLKIPVLSPMRKKKAYSFTSVEKKYRKQ